MEEVKIIVIDVLKAAATAVATAVVPIITYHLVKYFGQKKEQIKAQTDSLKFKNVLDEVEKAVSTAVTYTSQTFVDAMKKDGLFDVEAQKEAFSKSMSTTILLLSTAAQNTLKALYGDLQDYLTPYIEAQVKLQKETPAAVLNVLPAASTSAEEKTVGENEAKLITELLNLTLADLQAKASEYGVKVDNLTTKKEIAEAIVVAILNKA